MIALSLPVATGPVSMLRYADPWAGVGVNVLVAGIERANGRADENAGILLPSLIVYESRTLSNPNRCQFTAFGFEPVVGERVIVTLGGADNPDRLFAGSILTVARTGPRLLPRYSVTCNDDSFILSFQKITKRYAAQSVTDIVSDLMDTYAADFTYSHLEAGLDTLDEITFTNESLVDCLQRLAKRIGGTVYLDTQGDLHFFVTAESISSPQTLTDSHETLDTFTITSDIGQMVTRCYVEGGGPNALGEVEAGDTILPVQDAGWFNDAGGTVVCGPQRITYTGKNAGDGGSIVGTGYAPSSPVTAVLADSTGVDSGVHNYAATFVTGAGETIASPLTTIDVGYVSAPSSAPAAGSPTVGSGVTTGDHSYAVTFVTSAGETTTSPISSTVTTGPVTTGTITAPSSAPTLSSPTTGGGGNGTITVKYAVTFYNGSGETTEGPQATDSGILGYADQPCPTPSTINLGAGGIAAGSYQWVMTIVNALGQETSYGTVAAASVGSSFDASFSFLDPASNGGASAYKFYRTTNGPGATLKYVGQTSSSADTTFVDNVADGSLGAATAPTTNGTYESVSLTNIPVGPSGTTGRKVYATAPGGSQLKLLTTIANNSATTYSDSNPSNTGRLGANVPTSNTTGTTTNYNQVPLTNIPTGPANVTSRKLYRTAAGGSQMKLLTTIADNSTTSYTDSTADGSLGANIPVSNTAAANRVSLSAIPIGPSGTTSRKLYRTVAAGSQLKLLTTIADNTTTTYTDSTADASLGANVPTSDTSGLAQPAGQVLVGATSIPVAYWPGTLPTAGWAVIGNGQQVIRYTGVSGGTSLTGVPSSGIGAIQSTISYNSSITAAPQLTGIPSSGAGSIEFDIQKGDPVNLFVTVDDVAAQAVFAAHVETVTGVPSDGIRADVLQDRRISEDEARARGAAYLALRAEIASTIRWRSRDRLTRAGRTITVSMTAPLVSDDYQIQQVTISNFRLALGPDFEATGSNTLFSLEELLRMARSGRT